MKKLFFSFIAILMLGFTGSSFAQISWSGSLQFRPRDDIKNAHAYGNYSNDTYYILQTSLNLSAELGDGFFAKVKLEHYDYAGYIWTTGGAAGVNGPTIPGSNDLISRPTVNFNLMYFGVNRKAWGIEAGIFPISGVANPLLDIHYMPLSMVDIPFTIYRLNSLLGVSGYITAGPGKIEYFVSNDQNQAYLKDKTGKVLNDLHDIYTAGLDYSFKVNDWWFQPVVMFTYASDSVSAPVTFGLNLSTPEFSGFKFGGTAGFTKQSKAGTSQYDGQLFRIKVDAKVGPGSLGAWFDIAKRTDKGVVDVIHNYNYLWLLYNIPVYNSEHGSFSITPRWRHLTEKVDNAVDYSRDKIECLFTIAFK